jgi:hypothetical protein
MTGSATGHCILGTAGDGTWTRGLGRTGSSKRDENSHQQWRRAEIYSSP